MTATAPHPIDLSHHYSYTTKNRFASFVKSYYKYYAIPGLANFAGGTNLQYTMLVQLWLIVYLHRLATPVVLPL